MMQFSFKRVNAILSKDWKDLLKNSYIIFTLALPLIFATWIGSMGSDAAIFNTYPIHLALVIAGSFVQAAMVAEEKEKNTLRGLMFSPASTIEILIGKSALTAIMTIFVIIGSILLIEFQIPSLLLFSVSIILGLIIFITIGTILGLLSRTVMETSIIGMPVLIVFGMGSMFKAMIDNEAIIRVIDYLPSEQLNVAWEGLSNGQGLSGIMNQLLVLLIWVVVTLLFAVIIYRKRRFDK